MVLCLLKNKVIELHKPYFPHNPVRSLTTTLKLTYLHGNGDPMGNTSKISSACKILLRPICGTLMRHHGCVAEMILNFNAAHHRRGTDVPLVVFVVVVPAV